MAERLTDFTPRSGRPSLYPWDEWMDGSPWRITRGEDFTVEPESMAQHIRERGRRHGTSVQAYLEGEAVVFKFETRAAA